MALVVPHAIILSVSSVQPSYAVHQTTYPNKEKSMPDEDAPLRDVLWKMYQEHCTHIRHYETQRSTVAGTFLTIGGALVGLITFDKTLSFSDLPLTVFLTAIGLFGAIFAAKQYERATLHSTRSYYLRDELDKLLPGAPLKRLKEEADEAHNKKFPQLYKLRVHNFWVGLYLLIAILGLFLSISAWWFPWTIP